MSTRASFSWEATSHSPLVPQPRAHGQGLLVDLIYQPPRSKVLWGKKLKSPHPEIGSWLLWIPHTMVTVVFDVLAGHMSEHIHAELPDGLGRRTVWKLQDLSGVCLPAPSARSLWQAW